MQKTKNVASRLAGTRLSLCQTEYPRVIGSFVACFDAVTRRRRVDISARVYCAGNVAPSTPRVVDALRYCALRVWRVIQRIERRTVCIRVVFEGTRGGTKSSLCTRVRMICKHYKIRQQTPKVRLMERKGAERPIIVRELYSQPKTYKVL